MEKSACVNYSLLVWTLLVCFAVESEAGMGAGWKKNDDQDGQGPKDSIECYHCNSEYDPSCGDPFKPYTIGKVNCSLRPKPEHLNPNLTATICRKTVQKIYGHVRVIRECGYIRDPRDDKECIKRSGTHDVHILYCACTGSYCNQGVARRTSLFNTIVALSLPVFLSTRLYNLA